MILRMPDYFGGFSCIADKCKDSCCIGWEIDIDQDTYQFYEETGGDIGSRLKTHMYVTEDGEHSFELAERGRCPFLNSRNLCDICIELGEEALSEVCTEYPRFAIEYDNVLQKCLSLSCEEVGRIIFTRKEPVRLIEISQPEPLDEEFNSKDYDNPALIQEQLIEILTDRTRGLEDRIEQFLETGWQYHFKMTEGENNHFSEKPEKREISWLDFSNYSYENFSARYDSFLEMESLGREWNDYKKDIAKVLTPEKYEQVVKKYIGSEYYRNEDYENLLVYFTFRYLMNYVYDYNFISYIQLALMFTLMIRDMAAVRLELTGHFYTEDMIDVARIFSKEVEHSEENVELARENIIWG